MHYGPSHNFHGIASRQNLKMIKLAKIHCCLLSQNSNDDTFDLDWKFTMLLYNSMVITHSNDTS